MKNWRWYNIKKYLIKDMDKFYRDSLIICDHLDIQNGEYWRNYKNYTLIEIKCPIKRVEYFKSLINNP